MTYPKHLPKDWQTDLKILELIGSTIEHRDGYIVVRTSENPNYHWGNCILVLDESSIQDAQRWVNQFRIEFPHADWVAIAVPTMPADRSTWNAFGIDLEQLELWHATEVFGGFQLPPEYTIRLLEGADWEQLSRKEIEDSIGTSQYDQIIHEEFVRKQNNSRELLCKQGKAAWFGAFFGSEIVGNLGIVVCESTGRYQSVEVAKNHRRVGIASFLLGPAGRWSKERGCDNWAIVAEASGDARRVYQKAGFYLASGSVAAYAYRSAAE
jgi:GNAT superfamily N-acetyltransferase